MKVYAKIETPESIKNLDAIITAADGILISLDIVAEVMKEHNLSDDDIISKCKEAGKPIIIHYAEDVTNDNYPFMKKDLIKHYCHRGVDGYSIETLIHEDDPLRVASSLFEYITDFALEPRKTDLTTFYKDSDFIIRDYIIYNAYRIIQELEVKAIVCYTHNGYTTARLAALNPTVPIIAFTSIDETYRYINTLRAVKGFKISPNFNYENLKRIGKEMIRIIFKGNISLDDKIVIVQANEIAKDEKTDMIN
jgi:pyruvate kinase